MTANSMEALDERQQALLTTLIQEYIKTATPVASQALVGKAGVRVSPATIRNELLDLEHAGLLEQPYTSAGRIPTVAAWRLYIEDVRRKASTAGAPTGETAVKLRQTLQHRRADPEQLLKEFAKALADVFDEAVIVGFSPRDVYYTGLSHLFRQPEFHEVHVVVEISELVDRLDEIVAALYPHLNDEITVLLGEENPLGDACSLMVTRYAVPKRAAGLMAVLGPIRQAYEAHLPMLAYAQQLLRTI